MRSFPATLVSLAGLPASGKSTIARSLADRIGGIWLRIDSIEQAIRDSGVVPGDIDDAGYRAAQAIAADNLRLGRTVVADSVNPWMLSRDMWRNVGCGAGARVVEIEVRCSDQTEHRRRVVSRISEVPGLRAPDWDAVVAWDYHPWTRAPLVLETAGRSIDACVAEALGFVTP